MNRLALQLLGTFQLCYNQRPIAIKRPRLQALVAYLALHPDEPTSRQQLAFRFWPETNEGQAQTNLRKQILYLRQTLPNVERLIGASRRTIGWHPSAQLTVDVAAFQQALAEADEDAATPAARLGQLPAIEPTRWACSPKPMVGPVAMQKHSRSWSRR